MHSIITLTTDFGTRDGFAGQMKGVILGINPSVRLIDVTHDIRPFSVMEGALVLKGLSRYFPPETIHVGIVDPGVGSGRRNMVLRAERHYYVGPDNGLFSWILCSDKQWEAREIQNPDFTLPDPHPTFHGRDVFAPVAAHLSTGKDFASVGPVLDHPVVLSVPPVIQTPGGIEGRIIHIDRFGNLFSNIEERLLTRTVKTIEAGNTRINGISRFFSEAPEGVAVAVINSFGLLEIAVNRGEAASALGIGIDAQVGIRWDEEGSTW